jgi:dihydropteroate synthase
MTGNPSDAEPRTNSNELKMQPYTLCWQNHELNLGSRTAIMGIVNVTPDSFSDGGRFQAVDTAVAHAEHLIQCGADIIDIGGESTRPFARAVSPQEEIDRVLPVIERLTGTISVPISIDTTKSEVAEAALDAGAAMINDISALTMDPQMAATAARHGVPVILMHMQGTPRTMQLDPTYDDVVADVREYLAAAIRRAAAAGIARKNIIVDPGIGFGKTGRHNLLLIQRLRELAELGAPVLVGPSRKRFIRDLIKAPGQDDPAPDRPEVEAGTQAAVAVAVMNGAHIVRVHDVESTKATLSVLDAIRGV